MANEKSNTLYKSVTSLLYRSAVPINMSNARNASDSSVSAVVSYPSVDIAMLEVDDISAFDNEDIAPIGDCIDIL